MITLLAAALMQSAFVWIEGEVPSAANVKFTSSGWGRRELLSGGKWMQVSIDEGNVAKELPADGGLIEYRFTTSAGGRQEVWHRLGYENQRSSYDWRIDGGEWRRVSPDEPTVDMQEFETWNEVAWLHLGDIDLPKGDHRLELRLPRIDVGGKPQRVLFATDAIVVSAGPFHPNGIHVPGVDDRTDDDRVAAAKTYGIADQPGPKRQSIPLGGLWEIARDDEAAPKDVATPIPAPSQTLFWSAINVPGDKNVLRPDLQMAHRLWYRTRLDVPVGQVGRTFRLTFRQNSLNTTVYVNGKLCGFNKNPFVEWDCDVTSAIHAGSNEVRVGIRDAWYGFKEKPGDPSVLRKNFVLPLSFQRQGFLRLAYPVWGCFASGMLNMPALTVAGPVAATDAFIKPRVSGKTLDADITLQNATAQPTSCQLHLEAVDDRTGNTEKDLLTVPVELPAGGSRALSLSAPWANPRLWWPDDPQMYRLRATVLVDGKPVDVQETPFGFREWTQDGPNYRLNGIKWHGWAELTQGDDRATWLANYRKSGQRFMRLCGPAQNGSSVRWQGMPYHEALDWFDRNGVVVRRSGPLDGETIGYMAIEEDADLRKRYGTEINQELLDNVRDQYVALVKGERNHPSINVWSLENEWLYINCINLYGGLMDDFERDMVKTARAVAEVDPTRLSMTDGGGAGKANQLPIHGDHYVFTNDPSQYPDLAYTKQADGGGRGRWTWDGNRPRYAGEDFFATGINPADYAWIQGESAFGGKTESQLGMAMIQRMLTEGYRWGGHFTAWHLWVGNEGAQFGKYAPNAERALFCREQDSAFYGGRGVRRTFGVFNDSHDGRPMTATVSLTVDGSKPKTKTWTALVPPGENRKFNATLIPPMVQARTPGRLLMTLKAGDREVYRDSRAVTVFPKTHLPGLPVAVFDPAGVILPALKNQAVPVTVVADLDHLPAKVKVLVVGPDALSAEDASRPRLAAYAQAGHAVVVLEQRNPLRFAGLPVPMDAQSNQGAFAFPEDPSHPVFRNLTANDFRGWAGDGIAYRDAYAKPARGGKSLVQVGPRLTSSALVELPVDDGLLVLCQLQVGRHLEDSPVATNLFANLLNYANAYRRIERPVLAAVDPPMASVLAATGLRFQKVANPLEALHANGIAVVSATPERLHALATNLDKVRSFTKAGGSLVLQGLTPAGLADYNKLVGVDHMIRPFIREKTGLVAPRDPLMAGVTQGDVVMYSSTRMFDFNQDMFVADDIFSFVVDTDDVAPFAKRPNASFDNTVNGFVSADGWKYIFSFNVNSGKPEYEMEFPKPVPLTELTWIGNGFYHKATEVTLTFDGANPIRLKVQPTADPQILSISPARTARRVRLAISDWTKETTTANVVGIDNISMRIQRPAGWSAKVRPMLNVGGLVRYPQGAGEIVLCNLLFKPTEEVAENATKKRSILATILRNLKAPFSGGSKTILAGAANLQYRTVDISKQANAYRNERGWFGDPKSTLKDLPAGSQTFADVPFRVYDFATSPVPTVVMLGGSGMPGNLPARVSGITVNGTADALFFLQTSRIDRARNGDEQRRAATVEMARYVIRYADGTTTSVPIRLELDIDDYRQTSPTSLPGARLGWHKRIEGTDQQATVWVQQWTNPKPSVAIASIDLEYGSENRGTPVLIAITAAQLPRKD